MNNFTYPRKAASITTGNLVINNDLSRLTSKFSFRDDLRNWQGFKFTIQKVGTQNLICTPINWNDTSIDNFTTNELQLASGRLHLNRPTGKKALLHSITYAVYDYHQLVPRFLDPALCPNNSNFVSAYYKDTNETLPSVIVGQLAYPSQNPDFAYMQNINTGIKYATYDYATPFKINAGLMRDMHTVWEHIYSQKTAPRSNVLYGMLPMDFYHNHFDLSILGLDTTANAVAWTWNNKGFIVPTDSTVTNHTFTSLHDEIIPTIYNEINRPIDDTVTDLEITVARPYFWIPLQPADGTNPFATGSYGLPYDYQTIFKLPVKVDITILYV